MQLEIPDWKIYGVFIRQHWNQMPFDFMTYKTRRAWDPEYYWLRTFFSSSFREPSVSAVVSPQRPSSFTSFAHAPLETLVEHSCYILLTLHMGQKTIEKHKNKRNTFLQGCSTPAIWCHVRGCFNWLHPSIEMNLYRNKHYHATLPDYTPCMMQAYY